MVKHSPSSARQSTFKSWLHRLCCGNSETLLAHLGSGDSGGAQTPQRLAGLRIAARKHPQNDPIYLVSQVGGSLLTP